MAEAGATDHEIADALGVPVYEVATHPALHGALDSEKGRKAADERVTRALYAAATGYTYRTEKVVAGGHIVPVTAERLPDPAAQSRWLEQRSPETWGRKGQLQLNAGPSFLQLLERAEELGHIESEAIDVTPRDGRITHEIAGE